MRPYLFQVPDWVPGLGGRPLFSYGTMLGLAFLVGWILCVELCRRDGLERGAVIKTLVAIVVTAVLGSRVMHFFTDPNAQFSVREFFRFSDGGMVAYGGMLGAVSSSYLVARSHSLNWWRFGDNAIPGLALGLGVTRIGCFLFGCDYGRVGGGELGLRFPRWDFPALAGAIDRYSPAYSAQFGLPDGAFDPQVASLSHAVHATQLYESAAGFILFGLLLARRPFKRFDGELILYFFGAYGAVRFGIEIVRGDVDRGVDVWGTGLTPSQLVSVGALILVVIGYIMRRQFLARAAS